jgi:hypothetical protein
MSKVVPAGNRKVSRTLRISPAGLAWIDQRAVEEGFVTAKGKPNGSELIRIALAYYKQHSPPGWRPPTHEEEPHT